MNPDLRNAKAPAERWGLFTFPELSQKWCEENCEVPVGNDIDQPSGPMEKKRISATARKRANAIKDFRCKNLIAVIEDSTDVNNIGAVIRNANALGVEKVYVVDPRKDLPKDWQEMREQRLLSRTSVSAIKWIFVKRFDSTEECLAHLAAAGYASVVTSPQVKGRSNKFLHEGDYTGYSKLAVWFGNESLGISEQAVANSVMCIQIPMFGMVESLNLATSSGIVLYEITRQRRAYQSRYRKSGKRLPRRTPLPTEMPLDGIEGQE